MTSTIQPLDAGTHEFFYFIYVHLKSTLISSPTFLFFRSFKARYKKLHMRWRMGLIEANMELRLSVLEAIYFAAESWNNVGGEIFRSC